MTQASVIEASVALLGCIPAAPVASGRCGCTYPATSSCAHSSRPARCLPHNTSPNGPAMVQDEDGEEVEGPVVAQPQRQGPRRLSQPSASAPGPSAAVARRHSAHAAAVAPKINAFATPGPRTRCAHLRLGQPLGLCPWTVCCSGQAPQCTWTRAQERCICAPWAEDKVSPLAWKSAISLCPC